MAPDLTPLDELIGIRAVAAAKLRWAHRQLELAQQRLKDAEADNKAAQDPILALLTRVIDERTNAMSVLP